MSTVRDNKSATITAQNTFTDALLVKPGDRVSITIVRTAFTGSVTLQRNVDGTWRDATDKDGNPQKWTGVDVSSGFTAEEGGEYRLGAKTGEFTGTSVLCRLGRG